MAILAFFNGIFLRFLGFLLSSILMWTVPPQLQTTIVPVDEANLRLQFSVLSDVHMESAEYYRFQGLAQSLRDIAGSKKAQDALVLLGDNTMNGQPSEYILLYGLLAHYNRAAQTLVAVGNHDLNRTAYSLDEATDRHTFFLRSYTGIHTEKPYYSKEIGGYTFIVLGDEGPQADGSATLSAAQLDWLDQTLAAAAQAGKPIFVFDHQPLNHTFPAYGWGGVGKQSEALRLILQKYKNILCFSGHLHTPVKNLSLYTWGGVTYVNLPTLLSKEPHGVGYQVEVYDAQVLLRARNYITGEWLEKHSYTVDLL